MLPLTFSNPDDYKKISSEGDRITLDLKNFAVGKPMKCTVTKKDNTAVTLSLNHTFNAPQIEWFKVRGF